MCIAMVTLSPFCRVLFSTTGVGIHVLCIKKRVYITHTDSVYCILTNVCDVSSCGTLILTLSTQCSVISVCMCMSPARLSLIGFNKYRKIVGIDCTRLRASPLPLIGPRE